MKDIMGKESLENKENRIDYKRSISGKGVERLLIISKEVKVSVQPIQSNENDKIKVTKKGKIKTTKIGYFFDCKKII